MVVALAPERDFRGPGCGEGCGVVKVLIPGYLGRSELLWHDPTAHEDFGFRKAGRDPHIVVTGPLAVDLRRMSVTLRGSEVHVPRQEMRMMAILARNVGAFVPREDLIREGLGWPDHMATLDDGKHALRVVIARIRRILGDDDGLIVTLNHAGYRLEMVEAGAASPVRKEPAHNSLRPLQKWARDWDACRRCDTTQTPHGARGLCRACAKRVETPS